jgi:hypothetical protein
MMQVHLGFAVSQDNTGYMSSGLGASICRICWSVTNGASSWGATEQVGIVTRSRRRCRSGTGWPRQLEGRRRGNDCFAPPIAKISESASAGVFRWAALRFMADTMSDLGLRRVTDPIPALHNRFVPGSGRHLVGAEQPERRSGPPGRRNLNRATEQHLARLPAHLRLVATGR